MTHYETLIEKQAKKFDTSDMIKTKLTTVSNKAVGRETAMSYIMETGKCRHSYGNLAQGQRSLCPTWTVLPITSSPSSLLLAAVNYPTECIELSDWPGFNGVRPNHCNALNGRASLWHDDDCTLTVVDPMTSEASLKRNVETTSNSMLSG